MNLQDKYKPNQKIRYLLVGVLNTIVGYGIGVFGYILLKAYISLIEIGVVTNILAITFSFITYKWFVFQTKGRWVYEYLRSYLVYGGTALFGIALLWLLVGQWALSIWLAQGIIIVLTIIVSYIGHSRFTFHRSHSKEV